jgi:menaquinone-dependent protoporphyrinogen oxidase
MARILILFGTTDGHTRKVANAVAEDLKALGATAEIVDARKVPKTVRPDGYDAILVAASVHAGGFQGSVRRWVRRNAAELNSKHTGFLPVCLGVLEKRPQAHSDLERIRDRFLKQTSWHPETTHFVAGALPYTRYGFFKKWVMKRISAKAGGGTDTSRDYEYTDWAELNRFVSDFAIQRRLVAKNLVSRKL